MKSNTSQERTTSNSRAKVTLPSRREEVVTGQSGVGSVVNVVESQKLNSITSVQRQTPVIKMSEEMKVHRGPLNLNAITMRDPKIVYEELVSVLEGIGLVVKRSGGYSVKCELRDLKFAVEINCVEKFANIFVIKFYKSSQAQENYLELCGKIFGRLNL